MKHTSIFIIMVLLVFNLSLYAGSSIRIDFQPDLPIDSIRIENLDNNTTHTFMGVNELNIFLGSPVGVTNPTILSEDLRVISSSDLNDVQILFNLDASSLVTCDIFDLQGRIKSSLSRFLDTGTQRFTFVPDARSIFLVRVTTATSTRTAKFISYCTSDVPQLRYDGFTEMYNSSVSTNAQNAFKSPASSYEYGRLVIRQNDLLRINCYSGNKVQTIYDYASGNKNYILRFTDHYHHFSLYDIVASKPSFVDVMFAVTDASNRGVDDLNNLDFVVKENSSNILASESFRHVQRMNQVPFQIKTVLLIDNSISIVNDLSTVKAAALQFVKKVRPKQEIAVYVFSEATVLVQDFTSDTLKLQQAINSITLGFPSTNLYGSIITALSRWNDQFTLNQLTQGSLIVFTDGNDTQSSSTLQSVLNARGIKRVYMIGLGNEITPSILNQISYPSEYISIQKAGELEETFNHIQADIVRYSNSFYQLNYMSPKRTGTHTLAVSTTGNTNQSTSGSATGSFSADGFQSVNSGVYLNISDSNLYGIDSIFCFYNGNNYNFSLSRFGAIAGRDSLVLKPTTYWAFKQPEYTWSMGNNQHLKFENAHYSTMQLKGITGDTLTTTITVQDVANNYSRQLAMEMHPEFPLFRISNPSDITEQTASFEGAVLNEGRLPILSNGFVWNTTSNPTVSLSTKTNSGKGKGSFSATVSSLKTGTKYYVKAYASNSSKVFYSTEISFTTSLGLPELSTNAASNITTTSAVSGGAIIHDGGAAIITSGVCWSTSTNPTIDDSISTNGTSSGSFTSLLTGLKSGTTFYLRAYATNSIGTGYGNEVIFTVFCTVTNPATGKTWIDRNLGASRVATSSTDVEAYGDLYQWGRGSDGHEKRNSESTPTLSSSDTPGHGKFITANSGNYDWRSPQNNNLWQGVDGTNNPCPEGFRIPTATEWDEELASWSSSNSAGAFASPLKLPIAGYSGYSGSVSGSSYGRYWSSTVSGTGAQCLRFSSSDASMVGSQRILGYSVRCIKHIDIPTITTIAISGISPTSAISGGIISSDGGATITARGVVWSTAQNPTVSLSTKTDDGSNIGSFNSTLSGLKPGTVYYLRAYATNTAGTSYGDQQTFTTELGLPELSTAAVTSLTTTSVVSGGTITHDGGVSINERGVCWSTSPSPTVNDSLVLSGTGSGSFTSSITGLKINTTYYMRAYAANSVGIAYGNQITFSTMGEVFNPITGRVWIDRNLGASRAATSSIDSVAYGDLYQWGRRTDGHEKRDSPTTTTLSNNDAPEHGMFIANGSKYDWRFTQNDSLWQGVNGINNPCPEEFRLPTSAEWDAERASWSSNNSDGAYESLLKLPVAGQRSRISGSLLDSGFNGFYWSSSINGTYTQYLIIGSSGASMRDDIRRSIGYSVRCIQD